MLAERLKITPDARFDTAGFHNVLASNPVYPLTEPLVSPTT